MTGFEVVGRVEYPCAFRLGPWVRDDDILFVSCGNDGPLRCGAIRARDALGFTPRSAIPTIADGDYVFRATAIGERIFDRPGTRTTDA